MTGSVFLESTSEPRTRSVPLAHLSLELGHLYMEDFEAGPERLRRHFAEVRPWAEAARTAATVRTGGKRARISTCFLIDDYFTRFSTPAEVVPMLLAEAERAGLSVDYLARESGCATAGKVPVAEAVAARIVESPSPGSYGLRPPAAQTGWLANGERSPVARAPQAMKRAAAWQPPQETAARRHSVFLDVEMWSDDADGHRTWSCPFLAAVWQLARLGLLRDEGEAVLVPQSHTGSGFPETWDELPSLLRLNPRADPFAAYRTCSVLPTRFLACGEIRTCLLPARQSLDIRAAAQLLALRADERVLLSERPVLYARSPDTLIGVDCPLPSANGARIRAVGTVTAHAALTEGRVLQTSAHFRVPATGPDQRRPWGDYLVRPGVVEPLGKPSHEAVAQGVLGGGRNGDLDVGLIADGLLTRLLRHPLLDQRPPFRSRPTRLRWAALPTATGEGPLLERFTLAEDELRTVRLRVPEGTLGADLAALCDDLALHDWLLTTVVRMLDGLRLGTGAAEDATAVVRALRPAVDHLLHLWMPRARVARELAPLWDPLEERPGFTRQWQALVQRIRDQLTLHAIPAPHREVEPASSPPAVLPGE